MFGALGREREGSKYAHPLLATTVLGCCCSLLVSPAVRIDMHAKALYMSNGVVYLDVAINTDPAVRNPTHGI